VVLASQAWVPLLFSLGVGSLAQPAAAQTPGKPQSILVVSYAVTKAAYDKIIPLFVADWKKKTGQTVVIKTSYGGSGSQTRAVIDGLEADVVALAMSADVSKLEKAGLVKPGWQNELPNQSVATNSTVATFVRPGNPKKIFTWSDLDNKNVESVLAYPRLPAVPVGILSPFGGPSPKVVAVKQPPNVSSPVFTKTLKCCPRTPGKPPTPSSSVAREMCF